MVVASGQFLLVMVNQWLMLVDSELTGLNSDSTRCEIRVDTLLIMVDLTPRDFMVIEL